MSNERRAALSAAFDAAEAEEEEVVEEESTDEAIEVEQPEIEVAEEASEETGAEKPDDQQIEQEAATRPAAKPGKSGKAAPKTGAVGDGKGIQEGLGPEIRAPQSWTPAEREVWGKIPKEAQAAIARVDREVQQVMSRSAESRKFQDSFVRTVQPYVHLIRAQNSTPLAAVNNLMQTAAGLTVGTQPQKAQIVAEIIANYGVDIQTLDDVLSKRPIQQSQNAPAALPQQFAEALKPIHQFMSQAEQQRAQQIHQIQTQAEEVVEQVATKLPFFEDLRDDMADIMELAAARGRAMTVQQAHAIAVNANPEVKKILDQRLRASRQQSDPNKIARARKAGSSIAGAPNGSAMNGAKPKSRRAALSEAWDDAT